VAAENSLTVTKEVQAYGAQLTKAERGMVQTAMLIVNPTEPTSADAAVRQFSDADNEGLDGGNLVYSTLPYNARTVTVVRVTYFPGDNEYGALFTFRAGRDGLDDSADLVGLIQDGDVSCLTDE
jgi:hypothetical protein